MPKMLKKYQEGGKEPVGSKFLFMDTAVEGAAGAGDKQSRAIIRQELGLAPDQEITRKAEGFKDLRKKFAKARRSDRKLKRIEDRAARKARRKGFKKGQKGTLSQLGLGSKRQERLRAKSEAINTGAEGERTGRDRAMATYFDDLRRDREQIGAQKVMEAALIAVTAGVAGAAGGGAAAAKGSTAAAAKGSTGAIVTGGTAPSSTMAAIGSGTIPTGATTTIGGTATTMTSAGAVPTASLAGTGAKQLTTGQKLTKALKKGKEFYDENLKDYVDVAKNIRGSLSGGEGGATTQVAGQPQQQAAQLDPSLFASAVGQPVSAAAPQAAIAATSQPEPMGMSMAPSMSGLSGAMQPQESISQQDNYNLSNFVNPTTMQNIYAEKGGRVKEETNYDKNLLEEGGRNKTA